MYTVLIQSKKAQESFLRFHPLLAESLSKKEIGVCQWVPSGTTLATAAPELYGLVRSKNDWRAVILRTEEDLEQEGPVRGNNPYDFKDEKDRKGLEEADGKVVDHSSDLIRLTHLLGGIPTPTPPQYSYRREKDTQAEARAEEAPEEKAEAEADPEDREDRLNDPPRIRLVKFQQESDAEEAFQKKKRLHKLWSEANEMLVSPPREIILVTVSSIRSSDEALLRKSHRLWYDRTLHEGEDFALRNNYPYKCRFLVYHMDRSGALNREKDFFLLWTALTILMINPTNSDSLQAGKLYQMDVQVDRDELRNALQVALDRLDHADTELHRALAQQMEAEWTAEDGMVPVKKSARVDSSSEEESVHPSIPDYRVEIPVSFMPEEDKVPELDRDAFGLAAELPHDLDAWVDYTGRAEIGIARLHRGMDRFLDRAAARLRRTCRYDESEVRPLSEYQQEDLRDSLEADYEEMLDQQARLPRGASDVRKEAERVDSAVRRGIQRRMSWRQALCAVLLPSLLLLAAFAVGYAPNALPYLGGAAGLSLLLCAVTLLIVLAVRRGVLRRLAGRYQQLMLMVRAEFNRHAGQFTRFLSSIASHIHGCSYLDAMFRRQNAQDSSYYLFRRRLKAFELLRDRLRAWAVAMGLELNGSATRLLEQDCEMLEYDDDALFSLQEPERGTIEMARTGASMITPFSFVKELEIRREEIVDDE